MTFATSEGNPSTTWVENSFGVYFGPIENNSSYPVIRSAWTNPYVDPRSNEVIMHPYMPSDNTDLINSCRNAFNRYRENQTEYAQYGAKFYELRDVFTIISPHLDPKDLVNYSEVNKCCYLTIQINIIWEIQCQKLFPNIKLKSEETCFFSSAQQFKIYFKRVCDELNPYRAQLKRNNAILEELRGPHGNDGKIAHALENFNALGGEAEANKHYAEFWQAHQRNDARAAEAVSLSNAELFEASRVYNSLITNQHTLVGQIYDGTPQSIDPNSQQGRCQSAIDQLPVLLNNQDKFEEFIEKMEAAKTNASYY